MYEGVRGRCISDNIDVENRYILKVLRSSVLDIAGRFCISCGFNLHLH